MKQKLLPVLLLMAASALFVACSSSSDPDPVDPGPAPAATNLSANISGNWSGQTTFLGSLSTIAVSINQPVSDSGVTAVALTGSLTIDGGTPLAVTGTKEGDAWSVSGSNGTVIISIHQVLSSATTGTGDMTLQIGPPSNKGTVALNLQKS